jgi:N-acetylglutamate synthase-like GNAT family acetyltransferase
MTIDPMREADRAAVHALLQSHKLPLDGFDAPNVVALVAREGPHIVGSAALETYGSSALLRSVAVANELRGRGVGQLLTAEALALARRLGVTSIFLLTETAAEFFPKFGFEPISRDRIPAEVQQSVEFKSACPASAQALARRL